MRLLRVINYQKLFQLYGPNYIYLFTFQFLKHQSVYWFLPTMSAEMFNERMVSILRWEHGDLEIDESLPDWTFHFKFFKGISRAGEVNSA